MSMDRHFYYDFDAEPAIDGWAVTRQLDETFLLTTTFVAPSSGCYTLLFAPRHPPGKWALLNMTVAGVRFNGYESAIAYVSPAVSTGFRYAFTMDLTAGACPLELRIQSNVEHPESGFKATWIIADPPVKCLPAAGSTGFSMPFVGTSPQDVPSKMPEILQPDLKDFTPGVGTDTSPSAGRFGYTKGDGVLDCAMPLLGVIDKMYLCGHPQYKKPYKWTYAVLPPGIDPPRAYHGSDAPAQVGLENDEITVNHLSVRWKTTFTAVADFFERKSGAKVDFACTYSLASPGILIESSDPGITLSMLEYAGNYQYLLVPKKDGVQCMALNDNFTFDGGMTENWMLIFGASEFPDLPILLVFTKAPDAVRMRRNSSGQLTALDFHIPPRDAKVFVATPFGIESLQPQSPETWGRPAVRHSDSPSNAGFIADAVARCRFWSRAFLAYPVKCGEYFKLDEAAEKVEIIQKFEYRELSDQWQTQPLKIAPLPPALVLLDGAGMVESDADIRNFKFPTKYGFLKGMVGRNFVAYKIPYMPRARQFPLKDIRDDKISALLDDGLDEYFAFHENFGPEQQAYPYAGSTLEPYAWSAPLFNFMDAPARARLTEKLSERLAFACDPERRYVYPIISWSALMREIPDTDRVLEIYRDPAMKTRELYNWYLRKEPFTGLEYRICFLNAGLFSGGNIKEGTREEVTGLKMPLIENDWGVGLAFYYIYLAAQIAGDFSAVRKNWGLLCEGFDYFAKLHDWACMATAYSDNGISWVEGANYGAFTSFVNMADALNDKDAYAKGVYLAAKQMALRLAIFRAAQTYFYRFFDHAPWFTTKFFHEENSPGRAFQNVPELWEELYRPGAIYNLTTEGLYPEIFMALHKFLPEEFAYVRDLALKSYEQGLDSGSFPWGAMQECGSGLIAAALAEEYDETRLLSEIAKVEARGQLIKEWRGIHIYSRLLPKNYFKCQLMAWLENRKHPVWLEHWTDVEILRADYDFEKQTAVIEFKTRSARAMIRFGVRYTPAAVYMNDQVLQGWGVQKSKLSVTVGGAGVLRLVF